MVNLCPCPGPCSRLRARARLHPPRREGASVSLAELLSRGPVVLYFYPRDETMGCTAEACAFRDAHQAFVERGPDCRRQPGQPGFARAFAAHHRLPFLLLSDETGEVHDRFGIGKLLALRWIA